MGVSFSISMATFVAFLFTSIFIFLKSYNILLLEIITCFVKFTKDLLCFRNNTVHTVILKRLILFRKLYIKDDRLSDS